MPWFVMAKGTPSRQSVEVVGAASLLFDKFGDRAQRHQTASANLERPQGSALDQPVGHRPSDTQLAGGVLDAHQPSGPAIRYRSLFFGHVRHHP